jgi:hypothetical protein
MIELLGSRRAMRSFEDCHEVVCLDQQSFTSSSFTILGLDKALEPEHGFVGFFDDNPRSSKPTRLWIWSGPQAR